MISFNSVKRAINLGKDFLPRIGAFELADILGITKAQMFDLIEANRSVFAIDEMKNINVTENKDNIFATVQESRDFFVRETCGGNENLGIAVQTKKGIASNITSPVQWLCDFEYAFCVRADADKSGSGAKEATTNKDGKEMGERVTCIGRIAAGGNAPDKWIFGVLPTLEEIVARKINGRFMYYHRWVQDDANGVKWVIPESFKKAEATVTAATVTIASPPVAATLVTSVKTRAKAEVKVEKKEVLTDIPGQQMLPGTDPKPVETAPPASIIKTEVKIDPVKNEKPSEPLSPAMFMPKDTAAQPPKEDRPPVIMAAASIKADIKSRALDEQAAATPQDKPPVLSSVPVTPKDVVVPPPSPTPVNNNPVSAVAAMSLLDSLLTASGQS